MLNLTAVFNVQINIALHGAIHSAAVYIGKRQGGINLHMSAAGDILVQTSANHIAAGGYANKKDAKVNGNITLDFINSVTDNPIYGGGYARSSYSAEVTELIKSNVIFPLTLASFLFA